MRTNQLTIGHTLAALTAVLLMANVGRSESPPEPRVVQETFLSAGKKIAIERYEPVEAGKYPAVMLLHAIDGLSKPDGETYRAAARRYAVKGYVMLMVSYFDSTGNGEEQVKEVREQFLRYAKGACKPDEEKAVHARFRTWMDTVADAVAYTRKLPNVDGDHVGLVGFSLGAYLALATAADRDLKLSVVIEFFGGLPKPMREKASNLPPTLIIHGDADRIVPVAEAHDLRDLLAKAKRPFEVKVYEGAGHVFSGATAEKTDLGTMLQTVKQMKDVDERTAAFLAKFLKPEQERKAER
jgi:carboxymethylenebutenolidase